MLRLWRCRLDTPRYCHFVSCSRSRRFRQRHVEHTEASRTVLDYLGVSVAAASTLRYTGYCSTSLREAVASAAGFGFASTLGFEDLPAVPAQNDNDNSVPPVHSSRLVQYPVSRSFLQR
jgi:hypothetical protein